MSSFITELERVGADVFKVVSAVAGPAATAAATAYLGPAAGPLVGGLISSIITAESDHLTGKFEAPAVLTTLGLPKQQPVKVNGTTVMVPGTVTPAANIPMGSLVGAGLVAQPSTVDPRKAQVLREFQTFQPIVEALFRFAGHPILNVPAFQAALPDMIDGIIETLNAAIHTFGATEQLLQAFKPVPVATAASVKPA